MGVLYWLKDSPPPFQKPLSEPVEQKRIPAQKSPLKSTFIKKIASGPKKIQIVKNSKGERYIADEIIVGFIVGTSLKDVENIAKQFQLTLLDYHSQTGVAQFKLNTSLYTVSEIINLIQKDHHPKIRYSEPNYVMTLNITELPNDYDEALWYLKNKGGELSPFKTETKKNADIAFGKIVEAWALRSEGKVIVAIPDTGIDIYHPDFTELNASDLSQQKLTIEKTHIWKNTAEIPDDNIDNDHNGYVDDTLGWDFFNIDNDASADLNFLEWIDENVSENERDQYKEQLKTDEEALIKEASHGTHIGGVIGALSNNQRGIPGIVLNDIEIMPLKIGSISIIEETDETTNQTTKKLGYSLANSIVVAEAIEYAKIMGAQVVNLSWGSTGASQTIKDSIKNAPNMLFVAAAGNEGKNNDTTPYYPASFQFNHLISVAATDPKDTLASFSNYSPKLVHVGAPGRYILSLKASLRDIQDADSFQKNEYIYMSGTSMAAGVTSGVAALVYLELLEKNTPNDKKTDPGEIKFALTQSARRLTSLENKTTAGGIIDLYSALYLINNNELPTYVPEQFPDDTVAISASDQKEDKTFNLGACGFIDTPTSSHSSGPSSHQLIGFFIPFILFLWIFFGIRLFKKHV